MMKYIVILILLYIPPVTMSVIDSRKYDEVISSEKTPAGHIVNISKESHWYGDNSQLTLDNGAQVSLSGIFNPWKAGDTVTRPVPGKDIDEDTAANYWCLGDTCLKQQ